MKIRKVKNWERRAEEYLAKDLRDYFDAKPTINSTQEIIDTFRPSLCEFVRSRLHLEQTWVHKKQWVDEVGWDFIAADKQLRAIEGVGTLWWGPITSADGFMPEPIYLNVGLIRYNKRRPLHYDARFRVGINLYRIRGPKDYVAPSQPMTNEIDRFGMTAMMRAAIIGDVFQVRRLISEGDAPNVKGAGGMTALLLASKFGHADVVKELANNGADVNAANDHGATALYTAALLGQVDVVAALLERGADIHAEDQYGQTALSWARFGEEGVMEISSRPYDKIAKMLRRAESELERRMK